MSEFISFLVTGVVTGSARHLSLVECDLVVRRPGPARRPGAPRRVKATRVIVPAPAATRISGNDRRRAGIIARASRGSADPAGAPNRAESALIP